MTRLQSLLGTIPAPLLLASSAPAQCANLALPGQSGCGHSTPGGMPAISCAGAPAVGNVAFGVSASIPCLASFPVLPVGTCLPSPLLITGPFGAGGFCGPPTAPCLAFVGLTTFLVLPPIPNNPTLAGTTVCVQEANLCLQPGGSCIGASQGLSITVR